MRGIKSKRGTVMVLAIRISEFRMSIINEKKKKKEICADAITKSQKLA